MPNVRSLHGVDVLVAGDDPRFLRAATFVLERAGYRVETTNRGCDIVGLVQVRRSSAVVLDGSRSLTAAARAAAAIEATNPTTHVLIVAEEGAEAFGAFATLPKWEGLEPVISELERLFGPIAPRRARMERR